MAGLLGVNVDRTISLTFVMGAALAAVAGVMVTLYYGVIDFFIGFLAGVKAFTAAVLGGIGSLPGAMLGGLLIGLIEAFWSAYFSHRVQGRGDLRHPGAGSDLPPHRPARQARNREGLTPMTAVARRKPLRVWSPWHAPVAEGSRCRGGFVTFVLLAPLLGHAHGQRPDRADRWKCMFALGASLAAAIVFAGRLALTLLAQGAAPLHGHAHRLARCGSARAVAAQRPTGSAPPVSCSPSSCRSCPSPTATWSISATPC